MANAVLQYINDRLFLYFLIFRFFLVWLNAVLKYEHTIICEFSAVFSFSVAGPTRPKDVSVCWTFVALAP